MTARRRNYRGTPEGAVQGSVLELLVVERIWHRRMQSRTLQVEGKGGRARPMFFGSVGMADILATPLVERENGACQCSMEPAVLWIECKAEDGRQSPAQKEFEAEVTAEGHHYLVARSIEDVRVGLKKMGWRR
jgi:hypothetical protein